MADDGMMNLSEVMIKHHDLDSFERLLEIVHEEARSSRARFFRIDVRPPYADTPENWEDRLEAAFY